MDETPTNPATVSYWKQVSSTGKSEVAVPSHQPGELDGVEQLEMSFNHCSCEREKEQNK